MSLYNLTLIQSNNPVELISALNTYSEGLFTTIIMFAIFLALVIGMYQSDLRLKEVLVFSGFGCALASAFMWFAGLIPIYVIFVFMSFMVIGLFVEGADGE